MTEQLRFDRMAQVTHGEHELRRDPDPVVIFEPKLIYRAERGDVPYPYCKLEDAYMPSAERVVHAVRKLLAF
jgi:pyruvate/2-oxoglutarate/acetoin dehydrogenase E1 component